MYNANSLGFVLSKGDQRFKYNEYAKQYPDLGSWSLSKKSIRLTYSSGDEVAADTKKQWTLTGDISELQRQKKALEKGNSNNNRDAKELKKKLEAVKSQLEILSSQVTSLPPRRKRGSGYKTCECLVVTGLYALF